MTSAISSGSSDAGNVLKTVSPSASTTTCERVGDEPLLLDVATLVLWTCCLGIGVLGLVLPYSHPRSSPKLDEPVQAEVLNVELTKEAFPPPISASSPDPSAPPPLTEQTVVPDAPPLVAVAEPSAIGFALPVEGPVQVVEARLASHVRPVEGQVRTPASFAPPIQTMTYGQGEGRQPAPEYPARAVREGQEGSVRIRFSVNESGQVTLAEVAASSPWRLLNDAALRVVRERWRFNPGAMRRYEVSIRFELTK